MYPGSMRYIWAVSLLIVILLGNVLYIFQDVWFFDRQFETLGSYDRQESVMEEAIVLMDYWRNDDVLIDRAVYTQAEEEHLYDVKKILVVVRYLLLAIGFLLLVSSVWLWRRWWFVFSSLFAALTKTIVGFVVFGLFLFVLGWFSWDWLFDSFHRLFFVDNWSFSAESFLIQSYPWKFFRNAMIAVLVRTFVCILLSVAVLFGVYRLRT